jgi:hypothetical protein
MIEWSAISHGHQTLEVDGVLIDKVYGSSLLEANQ